MAAASAVGIDDFSVYVPPLYLPIDVLAEKRAIPYAKLNQGLGLQQMAVTDTREDAATMAANAVLDLLHKNDLDPATIGRIYLGTESALDGAKPTATYVLDMLQDHFADAYGPNLLPALRRGRPHLRLHRRRRCPAEFPGVGRS